MTSSLPQAADKADTGGETRGSEDLFAVHDFDIKIDLDVPASKYKPQLNLLRIKQNLQVFY